MRKLSLFFIFFALNICLGQQKILKYETEFRYAPIRIQVVGDSVLIEKQLNSLLSWIEHFNNFYQGNGPLDSMIFHASVGDTLKLDSTSCNLLAFGEKMAMLTQGELNVGIGNLLRAWGIGWGQRSRVPTKSELDSLVRELSYFPYHILDDNKIVILRSKRHIAMGAYLEARILNEINLRLNQAKASAWLAEVGGDFTYNGRKPDGNFWTLGIKNPAKPDSLIAMIELSQLRMKGFSTSGDYEQNFKDSTGKIHHHILDPRTGESSQGVHAVSVLSTDPLINDALDTYFMMTPLAEVKRTLTKVQSLAQAIIFYDENRVWVSPELRSQIHFLKVVQELP